MDNQELKNLLSVFLTLQATKELPRQGFINFGFKRNDSDSVAAHSFTVCALAFFLARTLEKDGVAIDTDRTLKIALVHDMGEAISGDIGYHVKRIADELLKEVERKTFTMLTGEVGIADELAEYYDEYNAAETTEAKVVKLADSIDALTQMLLTPGADLRSVRTFLDEKEADLSGDSQLGDRLVEIFRTARQLLTERQVTFLG